MPELRCRRSRVAPNRFVENVWLSSDAFKMIRLLVKHAADLEEDFQVTRLLMVTASMTQGISDHGRAIDHEFENDSLPDSTHNGP
jgi:hypothetical protein